MHIARKYMRDTMITSPMSSPEETTRKQGHEKSLNPKFYPLNESLNNVKSLDNAIRIVKDFRKSHGAGALPPGITTNIFSSLLPSSVSEAIEISAQLKAQVDLIPEARTIGVVIERVAASGAEGFSIAKTLGDTWHLPYKNQVYITVAALNKCESQDDVLPTLFSLWDQKSLPSVVLQHVTNKVKSKKWEEVYLRKINERYHIVELKKPKKESKLESQGVLITEFTKRYIKSDRTIGAAARLLENVKVNNPAIIIPEGILLNIVNYIRKSELERPSFLLSEINNISGVTPTNKLLAKMLHRLIEGHADKINIPATTELVYIMENSGVSLENFAALGSQLRVMAARYLMLLRSSESEIRGIRLLTPLLQEDNPSEHEMGAALRLLSRHAPSNPLTIAVRQSVKSNKLLAALERAHTTEDDSFENRSQPSISPVWTGLYDRPVNMKAVKQVLHKAIE